MGFVSQATQAVSDAVSSVGSAIASSPVGEALLTVAGAAVGVPPMITAGLLGANSLGQGQSLGQALMTGALSYAGGNMAAGAMDPSLVSNGAVGMPEATGYNAAADSQAASAAMGQGAANAALDTGVSAGAAAGGGLSLGQGLNLAKTLGGTGIGGVGSSLATGAGAVYNSQQAKAAAEQQIAGITQASNILSPAYLTAGDIQAKAQQTGADQTVQGMQNAQGNVASTLAAQTATQQPFYNTGTAANQQLATGLQSGGQFNTPFTSAMAQNSDAEKFAQQQAQAAMSAKMAAGGNNLSTTAIQGAGTLAGGIASQYQNQAFNQYTTQNQNAMAGLQGLSSQGQGAANVMTNAQGSAGSQQSALSQGIGNANAAGTIGSASATTQGLMGSAGTQASAAQQAGAVAAGGTAAQGNIIGAGASAIGNQLSGANTLQSILGQTGNITQAANAAGNVASTAANATGNGFTNAMNSAVAGGWTPPAGVADTAQWAGQDLGTASTLDTLLA